MNWRQNLTALVNESSTRKATKSYPVLASKERSNVLLQKRIVFIWMGIHCVVWTQPAKYSDEAYKYFTSIQSAQLLKGKPICSAT